MIDAALERDAKPPGMSRPSFMALLRPLDAYMSQMHGDHEGGYPGNCAPCRILALLECVGGIATEMDWDDDEGLQ